MTKSEQAIKNFIVVREELVGEPHVCRASYFKTLKFYLDHSKEEAIDILMKEVKC